MQQRNPAACLTTTILLATVLSQPAAAETRAPSSTPGKPDAPLFSRPFDGVPIARENPFIRIVPVGKFNPDDDNLRKLQLGGGAEAAPAVLPPRFEEFVTVPSTTGMTVGGSFVSQLISHDTDLSRERFDKMIFPPIRAFVTENDAFRNRRTPGLDLDSIYRINPIDFPSYPGSMGPWDLTNLKFRFGRTKTGALDYIRGPGGISMTGDHRDDVNGVLAQIHFAFMQLHNKQVDRILARENIDAAAVEFQSEQYWGIFNEARNYVTAYYQGIVCNEHCRELIGRTLFEAVADTEFPHGELESPHAPLELAQAALRLHTLTPVDVQIAPGIIVDSNNEVLRNGVPWNYLFGPEARPASKLDLAYPNTLRKLVDFHVPGIPRKITLDLYQVDLFRGRETSLPSGEEYLAFLLEEHNLNPATTTTFRGKKVLTLAMAEAHLDAEADADFLADLRRGDTDMLAYINLEAELNNGVLGPIGQDIIERSLIYLLKADEWSLMGERAAEFTSDQLAFFRSATFERLLSEVIDPADFNHDAIINGRDMTILLSQFGDNTGPADLNNDGKIDEADVELLMQRFGG